MSNTNNNTGSQNTLTREGPGIMIMSSGVEIGAGLSGEGEVGYVNFRDGNGWEPFVKWGIGAGIGASFEVNGGTDRPGMIGYPSDMPNPPSVQDLPHMTWEEFYGYGIEVGAAIGAGTGMGGEYSTPLMLKDYGNGVFGQNGTQSFGATTGASAGIFVTHTERFGEEGLSQFLNNHLSNVLDGIKSRIESGNDDIVPEDNFSPIPNEDEQFSPIPDNEFPHSTPDGYSGGIAPTSYGEENGFEGGIINGAYYPDAENSQGGIVNAVYNPDGNEGNL